MNRYFQRALLYASSVLLMQVAVTACAKQAQGEQPAVSNSPPATDALAPAYGTASETATNPSATAPTAQPSASKQGEAVAIFAGGCFWCMEPPFDKLPGVISTTSGYTSGHTRNPTYEQTSAGRTGHTEAVRVRYNPRKVSYAKLVEVFWKNIDPFAVDRQFCDVGNQYRSGIYPTSAEQRRVAEASKQKLAARLKQPIATEITDATTFYPAESYHQDYYVKNPVRYKFYRFNCGRDARLDEIWGQQR